MTPKSGRFGAKSRLAGVVLAGVAVAGVVLAATAVAGVFGVGVPNGSTVGVSGVEQDTATADAPDLDLREANVVGVEVESVGDGRYDFSVTLFHDDDGEDGYANWWQVERLNGTELGRRDLLHAHSTDPFTRSSRIEVPGSVGAVWNDSSENGSSGNTSLVVVRGHDQTHGYGGQAMVVDLRTGATEAVRQGPEPRNFSECEVVQQEMEATTTTRTADGTLRTGNVTTAATGAEQTVSATESDLVACPWEESDEGTATG